MKLLGSPTSPYVRKVSVLLAETEQTEKVEMASGAGTPLAPNEATVAANPLGKVPCLVRPSGPALFDSRVIGQYLDSLHEGRKLYPEGEALWNVLTLEALADGMLDAALLVVYEGRLRPDDIRFPDWMTAQRAKVERSIDQLEARWIAHLEGPIDAGQIAVACALGYIEFRLPDLTWRDAHPALARWFDAFASRPSMQDTVPKD
jgi:glutathione S-transferase